MTKLLKKNIIVIFLALLSSCSQVLQTVELKLDTEDNSTQEDFNVVEKTLTLNEAYVQNKTFYKRNVLQHGKGGNARLISEESALISNFPKNDKLQKYSIGIGDIITFSRLVENNHSKFDGEKLWPPKIDNVAYKLGIGDALALTLMRDEDTLDRLNPIPRMAPADDNDNQNLIFGTQKNESTIETTGRIGSDGSALLLEVGRLEAKDKTLNELRAEVRNILIRDGVSPRFQLEIFKFQSQKAYLTVNEKSKAITLDDQKTTLKDIITFAEVGFKPGVVTNIRLQRNGKEFLMSLRSVFSENAPEVTIIDRDHIFVEDSSAKIISSSSPVDHHGNVVFAGVGKIKAAGHSLNELRNKIDSLLDKLPDSENAFQISIEQSMSQRAIINLPGEKGGVVQISDTLISLDQVLTENGLGVEGNNIKRINLKRGGNNYSFTLQDLLESDATKIYLMPNDRVTVKTLSYKEDKVFILGGVNPQIFKINPASRQTLADVLFTGGGILSTPSAKRSDVYLLRGSNPVLAFHLDAQSPTRLIVADAMELRPNDIVYVAEQPIISFNRTLATIVPLRLLLRDIQDENIP